MTEPQPLSARDALAKLQKISQYDWLTTSSQAWWSPRQVAAFLGVGERAIRAKCADGTLIGAVSYGPPVGWQIPRDALLIWLAGTLH